MLIIFLKMFALTGITYLLYVTMLNKLRLHNAGRWFILTSCFFSIIIPLASTYYQSIQPKAIIYIPEITVLAGNNAAINVSGSSGIHWAYNVYLWGIIILGSFYIWSVVKILLLRSKTVASDKISRVRYINAKISPFSFLNTVYLPVHLQYSEERHTIIRHEQAHLSLNHTADVVFMTIFCIVQWYNPFAWLMLRFLKEIHEYQADAASLRSGIPAEAYCTQIIASSMGCKSALLVSHFNKSLTLKRLAMMTNEKVSKWGKLKFAIVVPIAAVVFATFILVRYSPDLKGSGGLSGNSEFGLLSDTIAPPPPPPPPPPLPPPPPPIPGDSTIVLSGPNNLLAYILTDTSATFKGGDINDFRLFVQSIIKYPQQAVKNKIQGRVIAQFVVDADGKTGQITILRGVSPELDNAVIEAIKSSPDWAAAKVKGKNVNQVFVIPVSFKL